MSVVRQVGREEGSRWRRAVRRAVGEKLLGVAMVAAEVIAGERVVCCGLRRMGFVAMNGTRCANACGKERADGEERDL